MLCKPLIAASVLVALVPTAVLGASTEGSNTELEARSPHVGTAAHHHDFKRDIAEANDEDLYRRMRLISPIFENPRPRPLYRTPFARPAKLSRRDLEDHEELDRRLRYIMPRPGNPGITRPFPRPPRFTRASAMSRRALEDDVTGDDLARRLRLINPTRINFNRPLRDHFSRRPPAQAGARRALVDDMTEEDLARRLFMMPRPRIPRIPSSPFPLALPRVNRPMRQARRSLEQEEELEARMVSLPGQPAQNRFGRPLALIRYRSAGELEELD